MNNETRARAYLAKLPPAIAGQGGHDATFAAVCRLVEFGLSFEQGAPLLALNPKTTATRRLKNLFDV